jgi:hypothetical protein
MADGIDDANQSIGLATGDTVDITIPGTAAALNGITWEGFFQPGPEVYEGEYNSPTTPYCVPQIGVCTYLGYLNDSLSMALVSANGKTVLPLMDPSWDEAYAAGYLTPGMIGVHQGATIEGAFRRFGRRLTRYSTTVLPTFLACRNINHSLAPAI